MILQLCLFLLSASMHAVDVQDAIKIMPTVINPQVGVAVLIVQDGKILLGLRKGAHGANSWAPPGGHLEYGETFAECGAREVLEETGLEIDGLTFCACTNDIFEQEQKHYVTIFMIAHDVAGVIELKEPDRCAEWRWFDVKDVPSHLFIPFKNFMQEYGIQDIV